MNIFQLGVPLFCQVGILFVLFQQAVVMLEVRTATGRVADDGVKFTRREQVDHHARLLLGHGPFAVMCMQRSTAALVTWRVNVATVLGQHLDGVAVDIAENKILRAASEHGHAITFLTPSRCLQLNELIGEPRLYLRRHRLEFTQAPRHQLKYAAATNKRLETK